MWRNGRVALRYNTVGKESVEGNYFRIDFCAEKKRIKNILWRGLNSSWTIKKSFDENRLKRLGYRDECNTGGGDGGESFTFCEAGGTGYVIRPNFNRENEKSWVVSKIEAVSRDRWKRGMKWIKSIRVCGIS